MAFTDSALQRLALKACVGRLRRFMVFGSVFGGSVDSWWLLPSTRQSMQRKGEDVRSISLLIAFNKKIKKKIKVLRLVPAGVIDFLE